MKKLLLLITILLLFCISATLSVSGNYDEASGDDDSGSTTETDQDTTPGKPHIASRMPENGKLDALPGDEIRLAFNGYANTKLTSKRNWTFVNLAGLEQNLPPTASQIYTTKSYGLAHRVFFFCELGFNLASEEYYGNYSIILENDVVSITDTFQVLHPDFGRYYMYVTSASIFFQWNCLGENGVQRYNISIMEIPSNAEIETKTITIPLQCQVCFDTNIRPDTDYEVRLWSTDALVSVNETRLSVRTPKEPKLVISRDDIIFNKTSVNIEYMIKGENAKRMKVECCSESNQICVESDFNIMIRGEISLFDIPNDTCYTFSFSLYDGPHGNDTLVSSVKETGVASTEKSCKEDTTEHKGADRHSGSPGVIIIAASACTGLLVVIVVVVVVLKFTKKHSQHQAFRRME